MNPMVCSFNGLALYGVTLYHIVWTYIVVTQIIIVRLGLGMELTGLDRVDIALC